MLIKNHKAYRDYQILAEKEAGVALLGWEVKSLRAGQANLDGAVIKIRGQEIFLMGAHIALYPGSDNQADPTRTRKLLLKQQEIISWLNKMTQGKLTIIPLEWYNSGNLIKLKIALGRKKKRGSKKTALRRQEFHQG
jgi:SsrA-binding protein